mgnify:CR=1 FL=1
MLFRSPHDGPTYLYDADTPRLLATPKHFAYIKIAEGCDYTCAFCIIPTLRGEYRSRDIDSIVREAEALAAEGVQEVLLISQDSSFFGLDRKERGALATLLRRLNDVPGLTWIRMLYLYPTTITDDVLDAMAECAKVCKYIDLPLQHASDAVLKRMKRPGSRRKYDELLRRIQAREPGVSLRTTFIVGFPGETESEFRELLDWLEIAQLDRVGAFKYSPVEGARANDAGVHIAPEVQEERLSRFMERAQQISAARLARRVGRTETVLVDVVEGNVAIARSRGDAPEIDGIVRITRGGKLPVGEFAQVKITGADAYDLKAVPNAN